jgi:hypothetical protein
MLNVIAEVMSNIDPKHKLDKIGGDTIIEQPKMPAHNHHPASPFRLLRALLHQGFAGN